MDNKNNIDPKAVQEAKANGQPYAKQFDEDYERMTPAERAEVDRMMTQLSEIIGLDDDDSEEKE